MHGYNTSEHWRTRHAEIARTYRKEHAEEYNAYERERSKSPRRKQWTREYNQRYNNTHKKEIYEYQKRYRQADVARQATYHRRRKSREAGLETTLTHNQWIEILEKYNYSCYYCGATGVPLEREHKIPVLRGGGLTAENIVPSCGPCNRRKKARTPEEYAEFLESLNES